MLDNFIKDGILTYKEIYYYRNYPNTIKFIFNIKRTNIMINDIMYKISLIKQKIINKINKHIMEV